MTEAPARLITFYLPQFHPIPENDSWWGPGFTEWVNVAKARPLFRGHYQPHVPERLGYYDLRLGETRAAQAELARRFGIHGFCYYHYWFSGRRLLDRPFAEVLGSGEPDLPFCLCWANENWTRRWDGKDNEILLRQEYSREDDLDHIRWLAGVFADRRYISVGGRPLFLVYNAFSLPDALRTTGLWREEVIRLGLPEPYLCMVAASRRVDATPERLGFDAWVEFQPDWPGLPPLIRPLWRAGLHAVTRRDPYWRHKVYRYEELVDQMVGKRDPGYKLFPGVTPGWDNSPRRTSKGASIFVGSTPQLYGKWLRSAARVAARRFVGEERLVFINAWNEWAEGNHLEPDRKWGLAYLEQTCRAMETAVEADV